MNTLPEKTQNCMTVTEALADVKWGDITGDEAVRAIYSGLPENQTIRSMTQGMALDPSAWYTWAGSIVEDAIQGQPRRVKPGWYWIPQPLSGAAVQAAVDRHGWYSVDGVGKGVGTATVARCVCAAAEIDHIPIAEQAKVWDNIAAETGCPLTCVVMSGDSRIPGAEAGKSLHVYWALRSDTDQKTWDRIQAHLIAIGRSDPAIKNPDRKMRRPGAVRGNRYQTVLLARPGAVDAQVLLAGLQRLATAEGIADVDVATRAIAWGLRMAQRAKKELSPGSRDQLLILGVSQRTLEARAISSADEATATLIFGRTARPGKGAGLSLGRAASGAERRVLPPDHLVTYPGGSIRLDAVTSHIRCACLEHASASGASAFADIGDGGPYICCPSCNITWHCDDPQVTRWVLGAPVSLADEDEVEDAEGEASDEAVEAFFTQDEEPVVEDGTPKTQIVNSRYLPELTPTARVTYVRSPQGTGKTYGLSHAALSGQRVLAISHRVSLLEKLCQDWALTNYQVFRGVKTIEAPRLGITINSLPKVTLPGPLDALSEDAEGYDLVIIDESEQVIRHLYGGTVKSKDIAATYRAMERVIRSAKRVVCMDADMSLLSVRAMRRWMGWPLDVASTDEELIDNQYRGWDRDLVHYQEKADLLARLRQDWEDGKKVWVSCDGKKTAEVISALLDTWVPNKAILTVTADTRMDEEPVDLFTRPNWAIRRWDAVVVSPAVSTGLSIEEAHVDVIYLLLAGGSVIAADGVQMAYRVRNPKETTIRAWVTRRVERKNTNPEQIQRDKEWLNDDAVKLALRWQVIDGTPQLVSEDADIWASWAEVEGYERLGRNNMRAALARVCADRGIATSQAPELDHDARLALTRATRAAREKITDEIAQAVASARVLTQGEYEELASRRNGLPTAEQYALRRHEIAEFYGVVVTPELVILDDGNKYRGVVRKYVSLELAREGEKAKVAQADIASMRHGVRARYTHYAQSAVLLDALLALHGIPRGTDLSTHTGVLHTPSAGQWVKIVQMGAAIHELCGVTVPDDATRAKEPMRMLSYLLRGIGLSLTRKQTRTTAGRIREYSLDPEALREILTLSRARRERITGGGILVQPTQADLAAQSAWDRAMESLMDTV